MARAVTPQEPRPHSSIKPKQGTSEVVPPAPTKRSAETLRQLTECRWRARPSKSAGLRRQSGGKTDTSTRLLRSAAGVVPRRRRKAPTKCDLTENPPASPTNTEER